MKSLPDRKILDEIWEIATRIEWTVEDWKDFYRSLSMFFVRVVGRHAKNKLSAQKPDPLRSEITEKS